LGNEALEHRRICRCCARVSSTRICCCSGGYQTRWKSLPANRSSRSGDN